jgi:hypothetical protein
MVSPYIEIPLFELLGKEKDRVLKGYGSRSLLPKD